VRVFLKCDAPTPFLEATPSIVGVVDGLWYCTQPVLILNFCGKNTHWVRHLLCLDCYVVVYCILSYWVSVFLKCDAPTHFLEATPSIMGGVDTLWYSP
jgi:hypothetical protein